MIGNPAHLLNEAAGCGMSGADICDVATEYFTHGSKSESRPNFVYANL